MPRPDAMDRLRMAEEDARYASQCIQIVQALATRTDGPEPERLDVLIEQARRVVSQRGR